MDGIHTPLVTPLTAAGRVDTGSLERLARHCLDGGAAGLVALATTGESTLLAPDERRTVLEVCRAVSTEYGTPLTVGAGGAGTADAIVQARERAPYADALLVVVPYYVRPSDQGVLDHFAAVGAAVDVPLLPYEIPYRTGKRLAAATLLRLLELDCVAGMKYCPGALDHDVLAVLAAGTGKAVLCGDDPFLLPMLHLGAAGGITASACLAPGAYAAMARAVRDGDARHARALHDALLPMVEALFAEPAPSVLKGALAGTGLIDHPDVRAPLEAASPALITRALKARPLI